jgi:hypothetical protein
VAPIEWLCLAAGLLLSWRYRWLLEDAFVYFRYVDNWVHLGVGLVYNAGEYVEGYTSPLWLLVLSLFRASGADLWYVVLGLGALVFIGFWAQLVRLNRELSPPGAVLNVPLIYLTATYGTLCYFTSGVETPLVQLMAVLFARLVVQPQSRALQIACGLLPLIRPDLAVPYALGVAWCWYRNRRLPGWLLATGVATGGGWILFRIYYYADLLPNTFYLKNLVDYRQGLVFLHDSLATYHTYELAAVAIAVWIWLAGRHGSEQLASASRGMMLCAAVASTAYVVRVGGDPRHYRFLAFAFPLAIAATAGLAERLLSGKRLERWSLPAGACLYLLFASFYPPQLDRHPVTRREEHEVLNEINDASLHRHLEALQHGEWSRDVTPEKLRYFRQQWAKGRYREIYLAGWCVGHYRRLNHLAINPFGLTDPLLARTIMPAERPAHKYGLEPLAQDLADLQDPGSWPERGRYRRAVEEGRAPRWIVENLEAIEVIDRKTLNRHDLRENVSLAMRFPRVYPAKDE